MGYGLWAMGYGVMISVPCLLSPIAYRLSPIAYRLSPIAYRLSPIAHRLYSLRKPPGAHVPIMVDGVENALLRYLRVLPPDRLDPSALQILVDGEEVFNLFEIVRRQVGVVGDTIKERVVVQHRQDFVVRLAFIVHAEHPDRAGLDDAAGEGRQVRHHQHVERVVVVVVGLRDESIIAGVMNRRVEHPVELEGAGLLVVLIFIARAFGDLDDHVDYIWRVGARIKLVP